MGDLVRLRSIVRLGLACLALSVSGCDGTGDHDPAAAQIAAGAVVFRQCAACHTIDEHAPDADAPNLWGVVGAPVAQRRPRYGYTAALRSFGGNWTTSGWMRG